MSTIAIVTPDPTKQFFDNNGNPLANGKLYAYAAGSSTPQDTYSDSMLTTPNTNPVVLDASGRATIYLGPVVYKFTLTDSNGVQIWSQDNIAGSVWPARVLGQVTLSPAVGANALAHQFASTLNKAGSGTHSLFAQAYFPAPTINAGGATVTEAATVYIVGAPSGGAANYALHVAAGTAKFDGPMQFGTGQVSLGGGAGATLGTIGGAGPTAAGQNAWLQLIDSTGANIWVPYWK